MSNIYTDVDGNIVVLKQVAGVQFSHYTEKGYMYYVYLNNNRQAIRMDLTNPTAFGAAIDQANN